jgi:hypothetical protein
MIEGGGSAVVSKFGQCAISCGKLPDGLTLRCSPKLTGPLTNSCSSSLPRLLGRSTNVSMYCCVANMMAVSSSCKSLRCKLAGYCSRPTAQTRRYVEKSGELLIKASNNLGAELGC